MTQKPKKITATLGDARNALLGAEANFAKELHTFNGIEIEVRQPSVGTRSLLTKHAEVVDGKKMRFDMNLFLLYGVIYCCFVPGTNDRIFKVEDISQFDEMPTGSWVDDIAEIVQRLSNVTVAQAKKN